MFKLIRLSPPGFFDTRKYSLLIKSSAVSAIFPALDSLATDCCFLIFANAQVLIMKSSTYAVTHSNFDHLLCLDGLITVSLTIAAFTCTTFFLSTSALAFEGSSDGLTDHDSCGIFKQLGPFHQRLLSTSLRMSGLLKLHHLGWSHQGSVTKDLVSTLMLSRTPCLR